MREWKYGSAILCLGTRRLGGPPVALKSTAAYVKNTVTYVESGVLTEVVLHSAIIWDIAPRSPYVN
jgi:hypothetical protein